MIFVETAAFISLKHIQSPLLNCEILFSIAMKKKEISKIRFGSFLKEYSLVSYTTKYK